MPAAAAPGPGSAARTTRPLGAGGLPASTAPSHSQELPQEVTGARGILLPVWETRACDRAKPSKELQPTSPVWIQNAALGMALPQKSCGKEHLHEQKKEREKGVKNIPAEKRAKSELKMFFPLGSALPLALCESQFGTGI